jgi:proteasome accessory factor C
MADDSLAGPARTFRVDRIESAEATGEHFEHRDMAVAIGEWFGDADMVEATVILPEAAAWVAETYPVLDVSDASDGRRRVRLAVSSERWLERLLLRAGPDAVVVEPEAWAGVGRAAARRLLTRYR